MAASARPEPASAPSPPPPQSSETTTSPDESGRVPAGTWAWIRAAAVVVTLFVGYQLLLIVLGWLASILTVILALILAVAITFLADPAVTLLHERGRLPKSLAVLLTLVVGLVVVAGILFLVGGPLVGEARSLAGHVPHLLHRVNGVISQVRTQLDQHGVHLGKGGLVPTNLTSYIPGATGILVHGITSTLTVLVDVFVALVISFWLLKDGRA
ncbi:MAG: AI-2E family transporter, partial [Candidatus Dormibacteria bacterium]